MGLQRRDVLVRTDSSGGGSSEEELEDTTHFNFSIGYKQYEQSSHLGNVLVTLSDMLVGIDSSGGDTTAIYYTATVLNASSFYPFGWEIGARSYHSSLEYKHGFNSMEKNPEINSGSYTTEFRQLDSRIGRWWSVDPAAAMYYSWSPYCLSMDNPIASSDPSGATITPNPYLNKLEEKVKQLIPNTKTKIKELDLKINHARGAKKAKLEDKKKQSEQAIDAAQNMLNEIQTMKNSKILQDNY